jgi:hypothetical protein
LRVERGHSGIESVDLIEMKAQQEAMVLRSFMSKPPAPKRNWSAMPKGP